MRPSATAMLLFTICAVNALVAAADPYRPQVGERHFDFTLPRIDDGQPVSLSDFRGRKVLLIHFASW